MKKLLIVLASVLCLLALSSCDDSMKVPDKLSCPAWMEGEWYEEGSEYVAMKVVNGDMLMPITSEDEILEYVSLSEGLKLYNELGIITEFSEKSTSSTYTMKLVIDGVIEERPVYSSTQYEITKKSDTQIELKIVGSSSKDAEPVEVSSTLTKK